MQKHTQHSNLECIKTSAALGRKSLLACAILSMMIGGNALADVMTDVLGTSIDVTDVTQIFISSDVGGGGNTIDIDSNNAQITLQNDATGASTVIGTDRSDFSGNLNVNSGDLNVTNGGSLTVDGNTSVSTLSATDITANDITANSVTASLDANGGVISSVGDGAADSDAVNRRQLNAIQAGSRAELNTFSRQVDARFNALGERIDDVAERAYGGIASVAALAAIPSPAAGKRFSVGAGLGNYSSESAVAVGFRAALTESTSVTAGVSRNTASKTVTNLGVGYSW